MIIFHVFSWLYTIEERFFCDLLLLANCLLGDFMRKVEYNEQLTLKLSREQRQIVECLAYRQETSLGSAARFLLDRGISAAGLRAAE